jgi:hypothetical protein
MLTVYVYVKFVAHNLRDSRPRHGLIVDLKRVCTECVDKPTMCPNTKRHTPNSRGPLVLAVKQKAKHTFRVAAILKPEHNSMSFDDLLRYVMQGPYINKCRCGPANRGSMQADSHAFVLIPPGKERTITRHKYSHNFWLAAQLKVNFAEVTRKHGLTRT